MSVIATTRRDDATLGIVAGGRARRLSGIAKGLLVCEGRTLIDRLLSLAPGFAEVILGADDPAPYARFQLRCCADQVADRGAPGGVHALLAGARTPWVLVVAADMPFVTRAVVDALLDARADDVDLVCFEVHGQLEPLLGVYRASLAPAWEEALADSPSFGRLFRGFRAKVLPEAALAAVDPTLASVSSVNTKEDAARLGIDVQPEPLKNLP